VVAALPRYLDEFEQPRLKRKRADFDRAQNHVRARVGPSGALLLRDELVYVVGDEVAVGPVAVEDRAELGEHVWVPGGRCTDVPLDPGDLG
jgi:hypothetical protein